MKYRNEKTGAVIETEAMVSGGGWQPVLPEATAKPSDMAPAQDKKPEGSKTARRTKK